MMAVYNHWAGVDWTTGLPLELEVWHYNSIGKLVPRVHNMNSCLYNMPITPQIVVN